MLNLFQHPTCNSIKNYIIARNESIARRKASLQSRDYFVPTNAVTKKSQEPSRFPILILNSYTLILKICYCAPCEASALL